MFSNSTISPNQQYLNCLTEQNISANYLKKFTLDYSPKNVSLKNQDTMYYYTPPLKSRDTSHIACFDLDWTLTYGRNQAFPVKPDDIFLLNHRLEILTSLFVNKGYIIAIFTNQKAIPKSSEGVQRKKNILNRMTEFIKMIKIPIFMFIATGDDEYRKPEIGMYKFFINYLNANFPPCEKRTSFYCGDAGGREQDFSDSDFKFAEKANIPFITPDVFFPNDEEMIKSWVGNLQSPFCVLLVGAPATGKTTFYNKYLLSLKTVHINQDILKTKAKVMKTFESAVYLKKNIVVDMTLSNKKSREPFIEKCNIFDYNIYIVYFAKNGFEWNKIRHKNNSEIPLVPELVYHVFYKNFELPTLEEGQLIILN